MIKKLLEDPELLVYVLTVLGVLAGVLCIVLAGING